MFTYLAKKVSRELKKALSIFADMDVQNTPTGYTHSLRCAQKFYVRSAL